MEIEILGEGAFESALVHLQPGEQFTSEAGAMYRTSSNVDVDVTTQGGSSGGLLSGVKRMLASESFFFSTYVTNDRQAGEVGLAPTHQGEVFLIDVDPAVTWVCTGGSYLGSTGGLNITTRFQGLKGFVSGESLSFVEVSGSGQLLVNAFGRIVDTEIDSPLTVDTGHVVAFENTLNYTMAKAGSSWLQSWLAGEGFVMHFSGQGRILTQSHNPKDFGTALGRLLPPRKS
ncbi:MAG: TIGR00266 family protein [Planctomycetota bacterium]